jgi:adenylate kinase family enzyme
VSLYHHRAGVVCGGAGVGKGYAFGNVLTEYFGVTIFCTGDWCRTNSAALADAGTLVADELIVAAIKLHYIKLGRPQNYIVDCPRSVKQLEDLSEFFLNEGIRPDNLVAFEMRATRKTCYKNIVDRATRQGRNDDCKPEAVNRRLDAYFGHEGTSN